MNVQTRRLAVILGLSLLATVSVSRAEVPRTASEPGAKVYFIQPANGATVKGPVKVVMGLAGMGVAPAGTDAANTGHHHLVVDAKTPPADGVIPIDANHRHFGKGQTETTLELPPGKHTLQLVFADKNHIPHNPPVVSEVITVTVE